MKKILAVILSVTIVMSLAACSGKKQPDQPTINPSDRVGMSFETVPNESEPDATTTAAIANPASQYVKDELTKVKVTYEADPEDGDGKEEEDELEYHMPQLLIKSSYADKVNKEISSAVEKYKKDIEKEEAEHIFGTAYVANLSKDNILSLVFISYEETDMNVYKVYNIDVTTGEKVDNARIAKAAGVSDIRKAAMDALQNLYNNMEIVKVENYKVVLEKGKKLDGQMKDVEKSFSEKFLNDKMQIGLTGEGKMFFVSQVCTMAGADFYDYVYDSDGYTLDDEDNPNYTGPRYPDEDDEDEDEEDEDDDLPDDPDM